MSRLPLILPWRSTQGRRTPPNYIPLWLPLPQRMAIPQASMLLGWLNKILSTLERPGTSGIKYVVVSPIWRSTNSDSIAIVGFEYRCNCSWWIQRLYYRWPGKRCYRAKLILRPYWKIPYWVHGIHICVHLASDLVFVLCLYRLQSVVMFHVLTRTPLDMFLNSIQFSLSSMLSTPTRFYDIFGHLTWNGILFFVNEYIESHCQINLPPIDINTETWCIWSWS